MSHIPVLLKETLEFLNAAKAGEYVDGTVGGGGHSAAILEANKKSRVLGIDLDQTSLDKLQEKLSQMGLGQRMVLAQGNFKNIDEIAANAGFNKVCGIILDLGFSSIQLDNPERGLSFQADGTLDMRLNPDAVKSADDVVNRYPPEKLEEVIADYGEEKFARRIAGAIIAARKKQDIKSTAELAEIIRASIPGPVRFKANDNIRRVFQAIRIEVNDELSSLKTALPKAFELLEPEGRLVVISFHSLEDRIVKEYFLSVAKGCTCPPEFPTCVCGKTPEGQILTRKPVVAGEIETETNPRSKSAKLRAIQKIKK